MVCGLGVYAASLLHLIAHSFYKAHGFLSSGSVVDRVKTKNASNYVRSGHVYRMAIGLLVSVGLYFSIAYFWGVTWNTEFQLLIIGSIIFLGVLSVQINSWDSNNSLRSILYLMLGSGMVINFFFFFEWILQSAIGNQIPEIHLPSTALIVISSTVLALFLIVVALQVTGDAVQNKNKANRIGIHLRNGLYFNLIFDRIMNSLQLKTETTLNR